MINTNDGYYFAEGARDIISGVHQNLDSSPIDNPVSQLTALLVKILPFSFETIILWMPAFLGSLLVVPLVLIGNSLKQPIVGIIAGFLAPITWSYYNRTMTGYYDTDMLTIVLPTFIVWGIVPSLLNKENRFFLSKRDVFLSLNKSSSSELSFSLRFFIANLSFISPLIITPLKPSRFL